MRGKELGAVRDRVSDSLLGADPNSGNARCDGAEAEQDADRVNENDAHRGVLLRYIDVETAALRALVLNWKDLQQTRLALNLRGADPKIVEAMRKLEERASRQLSTAMRRHPLWPWLSQYPGLGGAHTALVISSIGDPRRFPGRRCTAGCYHPIEGRAESGITLGGDGLPTRSLRAEAHLADRGSDARTEIEFAHGFPCPAVGREGLCPGTLLPPRSGTGVRSVWHYLGLHVDDTGRSPRKRKGQQVSWDPIARASVLQPDGIADQIVKLRVPVYRELYDAKKASLIEERGVSADRDESEGVHGGAELPGVSEFHIGAEGAEADMPSESGERPGLRPIQIHDIARKVAAKAFIGDLLMEWKRIS